MAGHASTRAIYAALAADFGIACTKFGAAAYTGSVAMLAEGIHSLVDTANRMLLLIGLKRSARQADERHPLGYGRELYFWAFVIAMPIFFVGGAFSIHQGIERILHPTEIASAWVAYTVLGLAIGIEGVSCWFALKGFRLRKADLPLWRAIRESKDPALLTVLMEDLASLGGLVVALGGIVLSQSLGRPWIDGATSVVIGLILITTAGLLGRETRGLLIGEAADPALARAIRAMAAAEPGVVSVNDVLTQHFGAKDILVTLSLAFADTLPTGRIGTTVTGLEARIKQAYPNVRHVFIEMRFIEIREADATDG